ncbi:hypothetical protein [Spirosoma aerolatum]|uniref:hypothetical protein n=1 Tax=Spirosoma aerolatum TaxID=1211326 RepID=UPI0009AE33D8|nr:hypothetical protein [Spirosoma aerolatum]
MRTVCLFAFILAIISRIALAQPLFQEPDYTVSIIADGKPVDLKEGIAAITQTIQLQGKLTKESKAQFPQLHSDVLIERVMISLVRGTQRIDYLNWTGDESLIKLSTQAQAGDRYVMQFEKVNVQTKQGTMNPLTKAVIYSVSLY